MKQNQNALQLEREALVLKHRQLSFTPSDYREETFKHYCHHFMIKTEFSWVYQMQLGAYKAL